eukprot:208838-Pleurochrysis_carterae.AAC.1
MAQKAIDDSELDPNKVEKMPTSAIVAVILIKGSVPLVAINTAEPWALGSDFGNLTVCNIISCAAQLPQPITRVS